MKKLTLLFFVILSAFTLKVFGQFEQIPDLQGPVTDLTGTLYADEIQLLTNKLLEFENKNSAQLVLVLIPTTGEESIEEYSMRLAEIWKIGSKENDDGVILLVAINDRELRIEIGYGMEQTITDAEANLIIDDIIVPEFKSGDYYSGINNGIDWIIGIIQGEITAEDMESSDSYAFSDINEDDVTISTFYIVLMILVVVLNIIPLAMANARLLAFIIFLVILLALDFLVGVLEGDLSTSWAFMIVTGIFSIIPLIINIARTVKGTKDKVRHYSSGSSGWSSSSSSSWSSGSSWGSSGSSYSGGGGSFGGGGASGSW